MSRNVLLIIASLFTVAGLAFVAVIVMNSVVPEGSPSVQAPGPQQQIAVPVAEPPLHDLNGTWTGDVDNGTTMTGTVNGDSIQIVFEKDNCKMIYWNGTFQPAATIGDVVLSSKVDIPKAVLSTADSKRFVVGNETMSFEISALGVTKTVELSHA